MELWIRKLREANAVGKDKITIFWYVEPCAVLDSPEEPAAFAFRGAAILLPRRTDTYLWNSTVSHASRP
jgi:hypothetical protein